MTTTRHPRYKEKGDRVVSVTRGVLDEVVGSRISSYISFRGRLGVPCTLRATKVVDGSNKLYRLAESNVVYHRFAPFVFSLGLYIYVSNQVVYP